jgi:hypothetical protein
MKMWKKWTVLMIVGLLALPLAVNAQQFKLKDRDFTIGGSGTTDKKFDNSTASLEGALGYFIRDNVELTVRQGLSFSDGAAGNDWDASTRVAADYYFKMPAQSRFNMLNPYAGINLGYLYGDTTDDQYIAGIEGGVKYFVNSTTFISGSLEYQFLFEDTSDADDAFDEGRFVYAVGVGFKF